MDKVPIEKVIKIISIFSKPGTQITTHLELLELELIDSLNVMQIIAEIEAEFSISIGPMDLSFDDFESPAVLRDALTAFI